MKTFRFEKLIQNIFDDSAFIARITEFTTEKDTLLTFFDKKFHFPYFGYNWDALWDILNDLFWIKEHQVLLIHEVTPHLNEEAMSIYINLLLDLINNWKEGEAHSFDVVFPDKDKDYVMQFLKK